MKSRHQKVVIAMSGGVDSSAAAALLQEEHYEVIGLWMQLWGDGPPEVDPSFCAVSRTSEILGIPLHTVDLRPHFHEEIISYFLQEYLVGRTPNPCVLCNVRVKFCALLEKALALEAEFIATGHYARLRWESHRGRFILRRGIDEEKDQSYFLWGLSQEQLSRCIFPNGELTKEEVKKVSQKRGFPSTVGGESQEICFIPHGNYRGFLQQRLEGKLPSGGEIVDKDGRSLGRHQGIFGFTIGQRRGIGIPSRRPYYVLRIDPTANQVVVGEKEDLLADGLIAQQMNWVSIPFPRKRFRALGRIRYRHPGALCTVTVNGGEDTITVKFDEPQEAITPGQALVLYHDDMLLGGGWISGVCGA